MSGYGVLKPRQPVADRHDPARRKAAERAEQLEHLRAQEAEARRHLAELEADRAAVEAEAQAEVDLRAEAAAMAARQGISPERALRRLRAEDHPQGHGQVDTAKMTPEQYRKYRAEEHGF